MSSPFMIDFRPQEWLDIWPNIPPSEEIINYNKDIEDAVWNRQMPLRGKMDYDFVDLENKRLRQGAFINIKDQILWLPPNYYHFLQYGIAGQGAPEFRLKELKNNYFKLRVRANKHALGTFDIKNRQDGRTTRVCSDSLWEMSEGVNLHGQINFQSKTNNDSRDVVWSTLKSQWLNYPQWYKKMFYSDFASGNNIETQMRFVREANEEKGQKSRNLSMQYYAAVFNAQDGSHNVLKCVADEFCKWVECSPAKFLTNTQQFMQVGSARKGLYEIISSPADVNHKYLDEVYAIWKSSDPTKLDEYGTTKSGLFAYHSHPLEGVEANYDKWGDADANIIYDLIMYKRSKKEPEELMGEVRANPLNEEEMFGSFDSNATWDNSKGIIKRKLFIISKKYKNDITLEPKYLYGNLEWPHGIKSYGEPYFEANPANVPDLEVGRFCFSELPRNMPKLEDLGTPPAYVGDSLGIDPVNLRYDAKNPGKQSLNGAINLKFRQFGDHLFVPRPTMKYLFRPHQEIFHDDMVKAALYNRAMVQYENRSDKLANYFEDEGYFDWLLPERGEKKDSKRKGDSPSGKANKFLDEGVFLINAFTKVIPPLSDKPYLLDYIWFEDLLEQIEKFEMLNTGKYDLVMAFIQALVGAAKISSIRVREGLQINNQMLAAFLA